MDIIALMWAVFICILLLMLVWGVAWAIRTYIIGQAPFIPDQLKQVLSWIVLVVAVILSVGIAYDFVVRLDSGGGHSVLHRP